MMKMIATRLMITPGSHRFADFQKLDIMIPTIKAAAEYADLEFLR
jgi:hypothetical protein